MKINKLALGTVMSVALTGIGGTATAAIPGILGEAALVPVVLSGNPDNAPIHTYVGIYVPENVGYDTITALYTAPHAAAVSNTQSFEGTDAIFWTLFDKNSKKIEDGYCDASPGDIVLWSTDPVTQTAQQAQRRGLLQEGILGLPDGVPDPVCGPTNTSWRFGYLVIQTHAGATRQDADFAFSGYAAVVENGVLAVTQPISMASIPVMPMADGADPVPYDPDSQPQRGNEVIQFPGADDIASVPDKVAPVISGNRMNNADGDDFDTVLIEAPIQGPLSNWGRSIHFFWFDRNNEDRVAYIKGWDDHEGACTNGKPMPRELDIVVYNHQVNVTGLGVGSGWGNLAVPTLCKNSCAQGYRTQLIEAVEPPLLGGYRSDEYCEPPYWNAIGTGQFAYPGAIQGNVRYQFDEEGEPTDVVNAAMVGFNWQESMRYGGEAWSRHMSTGLGIDNF
jgi:hypothetical protein